MTPFYVIDTAYGACDECGVVSVMSKMKPSGLASYLCDRCSKEGLGWIPPPPEPKRPVGRPRKDSR